MIRSDEEAAAVEEMTEPEDTPNNSEAFSFRSRIGLLRGAQASAPVADRHGVAVELLLQQAATELVGTCVNVYDHLAFCLRQY